MKNLSVHNVETVNMCSVHSLDLSHIGKILYMHSFLVKTVFHKAITQ